MAVAGAPTPWPITPTQPSRWRSRSSPTPGRWPSGDLIVVRGGIATGPAVAGVIGVQRFAYDLWGDTVNLASRLETSAAPGRFLVSESTIGELRDRYDFGPPEILEVRGAHDRPRPPGPPLERPDHGAACLRGRMTATRKIAPTIRGWVPALPLGRPIRGSHRSLMYAAMVVVVSTIAAGCTDSDEGQMRRPSTGGEG